MTHQIPLLTSRILHYPNNIAQHDQTTDDVQDLEATTIIEGLAEGRGSGYGAVAVGAHSEVEGDGEGDEEGEEEGLEDETADYYVGA